MLMLYSNYVVMVVELIIISRSVRENKMGSSYFVKQRSGYLQGRFLRTAKAVVRLTR